MRGNPQADCTSSLCKCYGGQLEAIEMDTKDEYSTSDVAMELAIAVSRCKLG